MNKLMGWKLGTMSLMGASSERSPCDTASIVRAAEKSFEIEATRKMVSLKRM